MTSPIHTAAMCKFGHTAAIFFYFVMLFSGIIRHNFVSSLSIFYSSPFTTSKAASGAGFGVFSVFCCLTFAWFTSKDEVTNRLSASADYNVSIIEDFVPPKQFTPGQTVKKEEAVVNTGSVDAFVKQTISGVLTVTVEVPTTEIPTDAKKDDYVTLSQKEFGTLEAGSMLAWKPAGDTKNRTGVMIGLGITQDEKENDFTPDATGLYVFRRAVQKTDGTFDDKSYDYVAYYYDKDIDGGTYFKVYALKVDEQKIYTKGDTYPDGTEVPFTNYGELKAEPVYTWTKTVTTTVNKQAMYYEDDGAGGKRLKVVYDGLGAVDATITGNAASSGKAEIYDAYNAYETKNLGETVYNGGAASGTYKSYTVWDGVASGDDGFADNGDGNVTGLTTYDIYNQDINYTDTAKQAHGNLDNFGLDRLTHLQTETSGALTKAVTKAADGTTDEDYWTLQENARTSRRKVNEGRDAAGDLGTYLTDVYNAIGQRATEFTGTSVPTEGSGLFILRKEQNADQVADKFEWYALMISDGNDITVPTYNNAVGEVGEDMTNPPKAFVQFDFADNYNTGKMAFATNSDNSWSEQQKKETMTADNVNEKRFADPGSTIGTTGWTDNWPSADTLNGYGVKWVAVDSPVAAGAELEGEWNNYVYQTRRLVLNLKKQELVKEAIANNTGVLTDTGRSVTEAQVYLEALAEEEARIRVDYENAKTAYETPANEIRTKIKHMNTCQAYVDTANAEYNNTFGLTVDGEDYDAKPNASGATITSVTAAKVANTGEKDTPDENTLEAKLKRIYGVAEKDTSYDYTDHKLSTADYSEYGTAEEKGSYKSTYACPNTPAAHADHISNVGKTPLYTYSVNATKNTVDGDLEKNDTTGVTSFNDTTYTTSAQKNAIRNAPYWKDVVTDQMTKVRKNEADKAYSDYQALLEENALRATTQQMSSNIAAGRDIILYVNLANIATDTDLDGAMDAADRWQYMGDASDTKTATAFDFGYTGILETGETSSILIKSVEFDKGVTQDAFKELKFDIDVALESAQAIYEGQQIKSDAAKESISNIEPSEERYDNCDATVTWVAEGTDPNPAITDNDPQPKDKEVAPTAYTNGSKAIATPVEITPKTVDNGGAEITLNYAVVVDGITYYGENKKNGTPYYALNEDETAVDTTRTFNLAVNP